MCGGFFNAMNKEVLKAALETLYKQAQIAFDKGEVPVAACVTADETDDTIYCSHNSVEEDDDPFAHAEILAIKRALQGTSSEKDNKRYLKDATIIVTLEPCLMCLGAILKAGIKHLYYILDDPKLGSLSHYHAFVDDQLEVVRLEDEDGRFKKLMDDFFKKLRS